MKLDKKKIINQYLLFKKYAIKYFDKGDIETAVKYIELSACLGYNYNFKYCDDQLEDLILKISESKNGIFNKYIPIKNNIIFFDSFAIDNRGLTQQYLTALLDLKFNILFICSSKKIGFNIKNIISHNSNIRLLHLNKNSFSENYSCAINEILKFKPNYFLQHYSPWDVLGCSIAYSINSAKRYLINLTDHAFWLGKNCTDFILEFRSYGVFISNLKRNIPFEKLLFQPYYPVRNDLVFAGLSGVIPKGKKLLFSGSAFYKIYGKKSIFLKIIKRVLDENNNAVFLFAGDGNAEPILKFIKENELQNRLFLLGNRSDINEVFKNIDVYVNTYPMIGGLMTQYAAINGKAIIGYTDDSLYSFNDAEDLLQIKEKGILVKKTVDDFCLYINELINDEAKYYENVSITKDCIISINEFKTMLFNNLDSPKCISEEYIKDVNIDINAVNELYIDMENNYLKKHYLIIWNIIGFRLIKDNLVIGLISFCRKFVTYLSNTKKKYFNK